MPVSLPGGASLSQRTSLAPCNLAPSVSRVWQAFPSAPSVLKATRKAGRCRQRLALPSRALPSPSQARTGDYFSFDLSAIADLGPLVVTVAHEAARSLWPDRVVGAPELYVAKAKTIVPALLEPHHAVVLVRLLADEGVIGARSTAGREGPVVGRAIRNSGSRPLLVAEIAEHWTETIMDSCLLRWSLEGGAASSRDAVLQAAQGAFDEAMVRLLQDEEALLACMGNTRTYPTAVEAIKGCSAQQPLLLTTCLPEALAVRLLGHCGLHLPPASASSTTAPSATLRGSGSAPGSAAAGDGGIRSTLESLLDSSGSSPSAFLELVAEGNWPTCVNTAAARAREQNCTLQVVTGSLAHVEQLVGQADWWEGDGGDAAQQRAAGVASSSGPNGSSTGRSGGDGAGGSSSSSSMTSGNGGGGGARGSGGRAAAREGLDVLQPSGAALGARAASRTVAGPPGLQEPGVPRTSLLGSARRVEVLERDSPAPGPQRSSAPEQLQQQQQLNEASGSDTDEELLVGQEPDGRAGPQQLQGGRGTRDTTAARSSGQEGGEEVGVAAAGPRPTSLRTVHLAEWSCGNVSFRARALSHQPRGSLISEQQLAAALNVTHIDLVMDGVAWR